MKKINPSGELRRELLSVMKPGRYVGGEYGSRFYDEDQPLKVAICFPDLYEIGMSNNAIKILYNHFNNIEGVQCERVFAPAPDFEEILRDKDIPLYSLETGIPLKDFDIIGFSIGYELSATNVLTVLELGKIPLKVNERDEDSPLIIAGGPAVTNPLPFAPFLDAVFIGEGEHQIASLFPRLVEIKKKGGSRSDLFEALRSDASVWTEGKSDVVSRAVWGDFGRDYDKGSMLPVPTVDTVQDHGVIEIMRGCPNGCRFCHAGYFYRPLRQKDYKTIVEEAEHIIDKCGYRKITLSSLSSGDYKNLLPLVRNLNERFKDRGVSFQLPSLRVNSVTLPLLAEISEVRKSSLTFAVETPREDWQRGMNKEVPLDRIVSILKEAKEQGWKQAKFYFMIGLPTASGEDEIQPIIDFLTNLQDQVKMRFNVNVGTFIPKPHTPFQWGAQFTDEFAMEQIRRLRDGLKGRNIKLGFHSPFVSFVEGILARGDRRAGDLIEAAWAKGARLDAWDEYFKRDLWKEVIDEADWDVEKEICSPLDPESELPWDTISMGVGKEQFKKEYNRAMSYDLTDSCDNPCRDYCGVCSKDQKVRYPEGFDFLSEPIPPAREKGPVRRIILKFRKFGPAIFLGHLNVMHMFEMAFQRAGILMNFTQGFNPKPKMEFPHPLTLGISSEGEVMGVEIHYDGEELSDLVSRLNQVLPAGFEFTDCQLLPVPDEGRKYKSLMAQYWGSLYRLNTAESNISPVELYEKLKEQAEVQNVADDYRFEMNGDSIELLSQMNNKKMNNIIRLLELILGENPLKEGVELTRLKLYKKEKEGKSLFL
ncbi:TIGR03936 family radical SAM-associated protein [Spirochaeta isovalerica]|uniref:Radical SAM-linked protein n=1 Tax=Spirochaeta isovalerica TaxID=150 RepID=A0A841R5I4_9SPIO|nr:TIGR03936 family radical SAM-associated protein [Spirochaeta isovalerica]MBB6479086.1 radical SAM-linked protein [Spirochaeta isovalerica]